LKRPLSLGSRLALIFGGLFVLTSGAGALLAARRAGADAEEGFRRSMSTLVRVMPAGTGVSPATLKRIMEVDVAGFLPASGSPGGTVYAAKLVSSLPAEEHAALERLLAEERPPAGAFVPGPVPVHLAARRYQVFAAWRSEPAGRGAEPPPPHLAMLLVPQEQFDRVRTAAAAPIALIALAGTAAAVILAWLVAGTVSRPVRRLAELAGQVARGKLEFQHVTGGGRELEDLSAALERMTGALESSRAELVRSERAAAAGQMAAALAHEVRNPLTGAKMTLEMLLAGEERPAAAEELRAVLDELARLELVVEELVSFARPSPPVFAAVNAAEVAREVLGLLGRQLAHARVTAEVTEAPGTPAARADRNKLKQVLVNLILNAAQAQPRGGEVAVTVALAGPDRLSVEVRDRGPGLPEGELEKVFAPFYTTKQGGAGLGLAVSRSIAAEHGGALRCRNVEGGGAAFRLELQAWKGQG
jgi:signal transduction histidine kinase